MNKEELMKKIQSLSFAKVEAELFLDTHPECGNALAFYRKTTDELNTAMEEYQAKYGPIVAAAVSGERWDWVDTPWPWQNNGEHNGKGGTK